MEHNRKLMTLVKAQAARIAPAMEEFRRELHKHPELGLQEERTARRIREVLSSTSAEIYPPIIETDVTALLKGTGKVSEPGHGSEPGNITLRADIDALALDDRSGTPWQSAHRGISHSCGHDGHTAMLAGAALVLNELTDQFSGSVRFIFQPAEELLRGGKALVEGGVLAADPRPDAVFALHGWPDLPEGTFSARSGASMAASDIFSITIRGKGGHGARPHLAVNPILTAVRLIQAIQEIVTQAIDPLQQVVISVCQIHAGNANNVIPDTAVVSGTIRYFDKELQGSIRQHLHQTAQGCCAISGTEYQLDYREGCPPLVNDTAQTAFAKEVITGWLGEDAWGDEVELTTGSEDFSFYLDQVPGAFIRIGIGNPDIVLHNPKFDFNDRVLERGITALCALALEGLKGR
jgi:amidohydrolase